MGCVRELPLRGLLRVIVAEVESRETRIRSEAAEVVEVVDVAVVVVGEVVVGFWRLAAMAAPARWPTRRRACSAREGRP